MANRSCILIVNIGFNNFYIFLSRFFGEEEGVFMGKFGKVLLAIILMVAVGVAFAASYFYTWTKHYKIKPLTSFEKIRLPETSGATIGMVIDYTDEETGKPVNAVLPLFVAPIAIPWDIPEAEIMEYLVKFMPKEAETLGTTVVLMARANPPLFLGGESIPYSDSELELLNSTTKRLFYELNYAGAVWAFTVPRRTPVYHETLWINKKSYVNFMVLTDDLSKLREHYAWLMEMEYIFHPGNDGKLGTKDDYLYAIVLIPLVNPIQQPGSGYAQILLDRGEYGVIKATFYWTKAVTQTVSGSFTIHIWAQEYPTPPSPPPS